MSKFITVTDHQYDWFAARVREGHTMVTVMQKVITLVDQVEKDLKKYQAWVDASTKTPKKEKML